MQPRIGVPFSQRFANRALTRPPVRRPAIGLRGERERAVCELSRQREVDATAFLRSVCETFRSVAVESTFIGRAGSQIARLRGPRAGQNWRVCGARVRHH
eukprot:7526496-Lingulodinium_polyedra.AAC.1